MVLRVDSVIGSPAGQESALAQKGDECYPVAMSGKRWFVIGVLPALMLLPQASALVLTPWHGDYNHWYAVLCVVMSCSLPIAIAYRRWKDGPEGFRRFSEAVATHRKAKGRKYVLIRVASLR
jgi:hypothetical protein